MVATLLRIDDPRDKLERANRDELYDFARAKGIVEITEDMPAILMRKLLRAKNIVDIDIPNRPLGSNPGVTIASTDAPKQPDVQVSEVSAEEDLMRQFRQAKTEPTKMTMGELRAECKRRGIKMARTDNMKTLRIKVSEQNPS